MTIRVDGEALSALLGLDEPDTCLDLLGGELVPSRDCPAGQVGYGRIGVRDGKRFIAIPSLDEIVVEFQERNRGDERSSSDFVARDRSTLTAEEKSSIDCNDGQVAAIEAAMNWLASLRSQERIDWIDDTLSGLNGNVLRYYDPIGGEWVRVS